METLESLGQELNIPVIKYEFFNYLDDFTNAGSFGVGYTGSKTFTIFNYGQWSYNEQNFFIEKLRKKKFFISKIGRAFLMFEKTS